MLLQRATQLLITGVGVTSSVTYVTQACAQVHHHGFRAWLEAGFGSVERRVEAAVEEIEEELT